jgi:hypothetical protein
MLAGVMKIHVCETSVTIQVLFRLSGLGHESVTVIPA